MFKSQVSFVIIFEVLAIALSYKISPVVQDGIPDGFKTDPFLKIGKGLYYIETKSEVNWFEGNEQCHSLDAELISFETMDEWYLINKYLTDKGIYNRYWTSGNDLAKQYRHVWASNGLPIALLSIWAEGQPSGGIEHCDELGYQGGLNDHQCHFLKRFICERSLPTTASVVVW